MKKLFAVLAGLLLSFSVTTSVSAESDNGLNATLPNHFTGSWGDETNTNWGVIIDASDLVTAVYWFTYNLPRDGLGQMWLVSERSWDLGLTQKFWMVTPVADSQETAGETRVDVGSSWLELSIIDDNHLLMTWRHTDIGICARDLPVAIPECQEMTTVLTRLTHPVP